MPRYLFHVVHDNNAFAVLTCSSRNRPQNLPFKSSSFQSEDLRVLIIPYLFYYILQFFYALINVSVLSLYTVLYFEQVLLRISAF